MENKEKKLKNIPAEKEDKILHKCDSVITLEEYQKMVTYFPSAYVFSVFIMTLYCLIIAAVLTVLFKDPLTTFIMYFVFLEIFSAIMCKVRLKDIAKTWFDKLQPHDQTDNKYTTEFYDDYFIRKSENITRKIKYSQIVKTIETETNFYLQYSDGIVIFQKEKCDSDICKLIREKTKDNFKSKIKEDDKNKKAKQKLSSNKKIKNPNLIKKLMIILFVATLLSLYGGLVTSALITEGQPTDDFAQNTWVFWLWLPIPLLSIVLGFKYKKEGIKCTKNIVAGFIMAFLLLIYGSFSLLPSFEVDYKEIYQYSNILNIELPKDGKLISYDVDYEEDFGTVTIYQSNYEDNDIGELEEQIKGNPNWLSGNTLKSELKIFIPAMMPIADYRYFSIYNKTTNEYNTMPNETGKYKIYVMMFDKEKKLLEINEFEYSYTV